jgi:lipooligosaccharide transport system permease protein
MDSATLGARVVPPSAFTGLRAHRILERNLLVYRRMWMIIFSGFFEPVFYLFAIGVGVGRLVGEVELAGGVSVPYAAFVAPAMLAASAMNGAVFESTMNIFFKLRFGKVYDAILATPMKPLDIAVGEIGWSLIRGAIYATGFLVVMAGFGMIHSPWAVLALPAALLIGFAFGAVGMTATTYMRSWQDFDLVTLAVFPLFLFSATFYPLDVYPEFLQVLTRVSPLYHGTELIRGLTLGMFDWTMVGHTAFLLVMGAVGSVAASRRIERLLLS